MQTQSIANVRELVTRDFRWALKIEEDELDISKETVCQMLHEDLRKRKTCAMQSRLTDEQRQLRLASCQDFFQTCQGSPNFLIAFSSFLRWKLPRKKEVSGCWRYLEKRDGRTERCFCGRFLVTVLKSFLNDSKNVFRWSELTLMGTETILTSSYSSPGTLLPACIC
jgi:hypothetical protein